ncbi:MAG: penicillin-binding transpeptidase domain-containing protein, partial [bacterium]|nr:penicillin-binding transpeptidase domain-containing protein [bacterium]
QMRTLKKTKSFSCQIPTGQGVSVTPIQQITAVSAAINGGILYQPYVVKSFLEPETGEIIKTINKKEVRRVISEETSEKVRLALESVVANGTGRNAYIEGYRVGGKTGTAQKLSNGVYLVNNYIVSFIGFLPADNPQVVLYVAIDNPKGITQYGGTVAAPVAKTILTDIISILNIEKSNDVKEKKYQYYDTKYIAVPNVVGLSLEEAKKLLKEFKVEFVSTGTKVISQSPNASEKVAVGSVIKLMLGE